MPDNDKNNNDLKNESPLGVPEILPIMALRNTVLFPQQVIPIYIGRERSLRLIEELPEAKKRIVVVAQKEGSLENPEKEDLFEWGTIAQVLKIFNMPDGSKSAYCPGSGNGRENTVVLFRSTPISWRDSKSPENLSASIEIDAMLANIRQPLPETRKIAS
jgi:ATP-dependent Lon protease